MNTTPALKIILGLTAVFALGAASGSLVTARLRPAPAASAGAPEERWQALTLADYAQRLSLTPEQVETLKPVFGQTRLKLATLRANTAERVSDLVREMNRQVMAELQPEQQRKLRNLLDERLARRPAVQAQGLRDTSR
jgi:Spy/CpxP family protein refolding chaperone